MADMKHTTGRAVFNLSFLFLKPTVYCTVQEGPISVVGEATDENWDKAGTLAAYRAIGQLVAAKLQSLESVKETPPPLPLPELAKEEHDKPKLTVVPDPQ